MGRLDHIAALSARLGRESSPPKLNVLSTFDGIGAPRAALEQAGVPVGRYYSSEVDPYAAAIARRNYPDTVELGDIRGVSKQAIPEKINLMCGGFPCQDLSRANVGGAGVAGDRSGLVREFVRVMDDVQPNHILVENVVPTGRRAEQDVKAVSKMLGMDPVLVDAASFGPMRRPRLWWTDLPVRPYEPSQAVFRDALAPEVDPKYLLSEEATDYMLRGAGKSGRTHFARHGFDINDPKARTVPRVIHKGVPYNAVRLDDGSMRRMTPEELERMFGLPEGYTSGVSDTRRYMGLGNTWSVPTAAHILQGLVP